MSFALTIPVHDPLEAIGALVRGWVLPLMGGVTRRLVSPFLGPFARECEGLITARDADEARRRIRQLERKNRQRAYPTSAALHAITKAVSGTRAGSATEIRSRADELYNWWSAEAAKSQAPAELVARMDALLYSVARSSIRITAAAAASPKRPTPYPPPRQVARGLTGLEVGMAAAIGALVVGRDPERPGSPEALEVLVDTLERDADAFSRYVAWLTSE
ncbi:MAG: hypothetical protein RLP09_41765 [Sandaracinaceae bacterium]